MELIKMDVAGIPIHWVTFDHDFAVRPPEFQLEWTRGNDMRRVSPIRAIFLNYLSRNHAKELMCEEPGKIRCWLSKRNPDREIVDCLNSNIFSRYFDELFTRDRRL